MMRPDLSAEASTAGETPFDPSALVKEPPGVAASPDEDWPVCVRDSPGVRELGDGDNV
jgi:hypothetical protein